METRKEIHWISFPLLLRTRDRDIVKSPGVRRAGYEYCGNFTVERLTAERSGGQAQAGRSRSSRGCDAHDQVSGIGSTPERNLD